MEDLLATFYPSNQLDKQQLANKYQYVIFYYWNQEMLDANTLDNIAFIQQFVTDHSEKKIGFKLVHVPIGTIEGMKRTK